MRKKTVSVKQIQRLDEIAINQYGIPSLALMENAGLSVAQEVMRIRGFGKKTKPKVIIFCGLGNNAGDGFVVARHLFNAGLRVKIYLIGSAKKLKNDAAVNYLILKKSKYSIKEIQKVNAAVIKDISQADVVIDAIFGVGLSRSIEDPFKSVIENINKYSKRTIAVDIPSGLNGTSGEIFNVFA